MKLAEDLVLHMTFNSCCSFQLNVQITNINLTQLSTQLRTNAQKIPDHATSGFDLTKIKKLLRAKARFLELLQRDSVAQIRQEIMILKSNVTTLKEHLKFNHTSLKDALESLISEVNRAQVYLRKNGTTELKAVSIDLLCNSKVLKDQVFKLQFLTFSCWTILSLKL